LLAAARRALPAARVLPIGTSAKVGGTSGCAVEAMEGFAVLRAAELAGVPAVEVRATSNAVDEPDRGRWRFEDALAALREALPLLLAELR
jgi:nucleoside phosphorylase